MATASPAVLLKAVAQLTALDPVIAGLADRHGPCTLPSPRRRSGRDAGHLFSDHLFAALAESVLYQQLAGKAAAAIHARFVAAIGQAVDGAAVEGVAGRLVTPAGVLAAGEQDLRGAGLSGAKASTILNLAWAVDSGRMDLDGLARRPDDEIVTALSALRGIGPWTANMFCIFTLGRLDVWPVTDYGVRKGWALAYAMAELPKPRWLEQEGDRFRPYRSVVAWYCWREVETS